MYVWRNIETRSCDHSCRGKSNEYYTFWVCVCSLRYLACNAQAPYCHLCPVRLYDIFQLIAKCNIVDKKVINIKCVFKMFSTTSAWKISHSKNKSAKYDKKNIYIRRSSYKVSVILVRFLWILNFLDSTSEKCSNINLHGNLSIRNRRVPCRQREGQTHKWTESHDEANSRFSQVCQRT
jgi:hypothetical protein